MFEEAAAMGASTIRLDIALSGVFPDPQGPPDWSGVDEYMSLARRYHLRVLANLHATPWYMVDPPSLDYRCPPSDPEWWGRQAGEIAAHTRGVIDYFEIVNEPDGSWAFHGTPQQYAAMLAASYDEIRRANPHARVVLGGLMHTGPDGKAWMETMLATGGTDPSPKFDIANIHVRSRAGHVGAVVSNWRRYFATKSFRGPLWVTEAGYPADRSWQTDPAHRGGPSAQASYLQAAIPAMVAARAAKVFVTERDSLGGPFASEGILDSADPLTASPAYARRPSFYIVHRLATVVFGPPPRVAVLGSPVTRGGTVSFRVAARGIAGQTCAGAATVRSTRRLGASGRSATIARRRFVIGTGGRLRVRLRLNRTGRRLLARFNRVPARLEVTTTHNGHTTTITIVKLTLKH